jgi:hypothetical protein
MILKTELSAKQCRTEYLFQPKHKKYPKVRPLKILPAATENNSICLKIMVAGCETVSWINAS